MAPARDGLFGLTFPQPCAQSQRRVEPNLWPCLQAKGESNPTPCKGWEQWEGQTQPLARLGAMGGANPTGCWA